jgi:hypothetical protein
VAENPVGWRVLSPIMEPITNSSKPSVMAKTMIVMVLSMASALVENAYCQHKQPCLQALSPRLVHPQTNATIIVSLTKVRSTSAAKRTQVASPTPPTPPGSPHVTAKPLAR